MPVKLGVLGFAHGHVFAYGGKWAEDPSLGIEFGSTRIKAVLVGPDLAPVAQGAFDWENRLENGVWTQKFQTAAAIPQGENRVRLYVTDKVLDFANDRTIPGPVLIVMQYGTGEHESSIMAHYGFVRSDPETWTLVNAFFQEEQTHLDIREDSVTFRTPVDQDHDIRKTIPLRMERDLRKIDFTGIPRTAEQAQELLPDGDR